MKSEWVDHCLRMSRMKADLYGGCRKIIRNDSLTFTHFDNTLQLKDVGYTSAKMRYLERNYLHEESRSVAVKLWDRRRQQAKYGSVGFTCYNHFIKTDPDKKSKRASVVGPCIQSVTLTWLDRGSLAVDVFYRTTELFKKFPADLVFLRDVLLAPFDLGEMAIKETVCHFANITIHPMYFVTILPHLKNPLEELEAIRRRDRYFFDWVVKWTARYLCPEYHRGIAKFTQAMRVYHTAMASLDPGILEPLRQYLKDNHPGYRNEYEESVDDD